MALKASRSPAAPAEIHSNYFGGNSVLFGSDQIVRNNVFSGRLQITNAPVLENNKLSTAPTLLDRGTTRTEVPTVAELEALLGASASGNISSACPITSDGHHVAGSPCIDAGTAVGAPRWDIDGDERDDFPDIGPDEFVP